MQVALLDENDQVYYDVIKSRKQINGKKVRCFDLEVAGTANYFVGGICVHNSIYSWRAALPKFMIDFPDDFSDKKTQVKVIKMETNYRSRPEITDLANHFMTHSHETMGTRIRATRPRGGTVLFREYAADVDEAMAIAIEISRKVRSGSSQLTDFAVICRLNRMMEPFQIAFTKMSIPFKVVGGMSLYEYKISQDLLAYLQYGFGVVKGIDDKDAFFRIVNTPSRGLGDRFLANLMDSTDPEPTYRVASTLDKSKSGAKNLEIVIDSTVGMIRSKTPPASILRWIAEEVKYVERMGSRDQKYAKFLGDKVNSLSMSAEQFRTTKSFLHHVEEVMLSGGEEEKDDPEEYDKVLIITIHRAKGLEFPTVYVPQMNSGKFPHPRAVASGFMEEERRLAYVACTRAKESLFLSSSRGNGPSEFIYDMGLATSPVGGI
jgi:DNA helicase-2/ATP-dependent DNA helicase PcrA